MPLINCEVNLILTWSKDCVITNSTGEVKFKITSTIKIWFKTKNCSFKRTINWNKYKSSIKTYVQNRYLNHLVDLSFQGVNRLFVLSFENEDHTTSHSNYYLPKVEIKDVMTDGKNVFD